MAPALNTTYNQKYVLVSKTDTTAVLRVVDEKLLGTYWKEFEYANVRMAIPPLYLRISQIPKETVLVDQYATFIPEPPSVSIEADGRRVDVSSKVTYNTPNSEVPGLYRIDYHLNLSHDVSEPIWSSYVSIQQRPILRRAAGGWTRDNYIIRTLNRLIMEPQFLEALHAAGEPLYGFMEANQHPSVLASNLPKYKGLQAWGAVGAFNDASNGIFITGEKLSQGAVVIYQSRMLQLRSPVWPDPAGLVRHMDPETHERAIAAYSPGTVVRKGDACYICINAANENIPLGNTDYWLQGYLYKFNVLNGDSCILPTGLLPIGKGGVEHIWITVDNQGYSFWVDVLHQVSLGLYRGYYDKKNYADYNTDDIVSYIGDNSIRLYKRKATDIQSPETLSYPPGHYLNPAWEEIYCRFEGDYSPLFSEYYVVPHTNASNAIMAKTWSVSEEMCKAYATMIGIPPVIIKECGAKWSALFFALLSRTRNTFDGLRLCMRAVGLDVEDLKLSEPSIAYYCNPDNSGGHLEEDIYAQHENLRSLAKYIHTLAPKGQETEKDGNLRYVYEDTADADPKDINVAIQQWDGNSGRWITRYRFDRIEPIQNFNNRYYDGRLALLSRLAEDAIMDLGDGKTWIKESAWSGGPSALATAVVNYEIPIYIYFHLRLWLYSENKMEMQGFTYTGLFDGQRCGALNVIELFPSKYYSRSIHDYIDIPTGVFEYVDGAWSEIPYTRIHKEKGSKIYEFDHIMHPIRIRALYPDDYIFVRYWQSTHTFGLLGLFESASTDHFINITDPSVTDESDLVLANGHVGVTALYRPKAVYADTARSLKWNYILNNWRIDTVTPFASPAEVGVTTLVPFDGHLNDLKANLSIVSDKAHGGNVIQFTWDGDELLLYDAIPGTIYLKDSLGVSIGAYGLIPDAYAVTPSEWEKYHPAVSMVTVRIAFVYG